MEDDAEGWRAHLPLEGAERSVDANSLKARPGSVSQMTGFVKCAILRENDDRGDYFEEAVVEPAMCVDYDTDRVIEIGVLLPDDDDDESGGTVETIACVAIDEARELIDGLEEAIGYAERRMG